MPKIDLTSDRPVYRQIADRLRAGIKAGDYPAGGALPSEAKLAESYDVTRMTARQAIEILKSEGLVRSEHGRGVFVREEPAVHRLSRNRFGREFREAGRGAYDVEMRELGLEPSVDLDEVGPNDPPADMAARLELPEGERVLVRRRRMFAGGEPMQIATSYVPWSLAEGTQMTEDDTGPGGIYSRLADAGHGPVRFVEEIATRMAEEKEARFLGFPSPQPVFNLIRTAFDVEGKPVEVCEHVMAGDRWLLAYEWQTD